MHNLLFCGGVGGGDALCTKLVDTRRVAAKMRDYFHRSRN
jgi:hypothetical protein